MNRLESSWGINMYIYKQTPIEQLKNHPFLTSWPQQWFSCRACWPYLDGSISCQFSCGQGSRTASRSRSASCCWSWLLPGPLSLSLCCYSGGKAGIVYMSAGAGALPELKARSWKEFFRPGFGNVHNLTSTTFCCSKKSHARPDLIGSDRDSTSERELCEKF